MIVTQYTACNLLASFTRPQKVLEEERPGIEASNLCQPYLIHTGIMSAHYAWLTDHAKIIFSSLSQGTLLPWHRTI